MIPLFLLRRFNLFTPKAKVIAHSVSSFSGHEIVTFEIEFWRGVLAEFNTHNALSKNTSSSRAIPVPTMNKTILDSIAGPVRFGKANTGMQDNGEHFSLVNVGGIEMTPEQAWVAAVETMVMFSEAFHEAGYAKQVCNRLTEVGQTVKMVVTATDLANFFWLRDHYMADPTIEALAKAMKKAYKESQPTILHPGDWHTPYYGDGSWKEGFDYDYHGIPLTDALAISASCCAQASYRKLDDTLEKAKGVVARLNLGVDLTEPCHASPTEHQGTPIAKSQTNDPSDDTDGVNLLHPCTWQEGITHITRDGVFGSGNLKGFIQYRQLIPGNVYTGEIK